MSRPEQHLRTRARTFVTFGAVLASGVALWLAIGGMVSGSRQLPGSFLVGIVALLVLAASGAAFTVIDIMEHRLPNALMLPSAVAVFACVMTGCWQDGDGRAVLRALLGAVICFGAFMLLSVARPGGIGGGDVKLAALLGALTAWASWSAVAMCFAVAFISAGCVALGGMLVGRLRARQALPFGPFLILGGWCGLLFG